MAKKGPHDVVANAIMRKRGASVVTPRPTSAAMKYFSWFVDIQPRAVEIPDAEFLINFGSFVSILAVYKRAPSPVVANTIHPLKGLKENIAQSTLLRATFGGRFTCREKAPWALYPLIPEMVVRFAYSIV